MRIRTDNKIYRRTDGRWCVSYYDTTENSKRHYIYGRTKNEVKTKLAKLESEATETAVKDMPKKSQIKRKAIDENNAHNDLVQEAAEATELKSVQETADEQSEHSINVLTESRDSTRNNEGAKWTLQSWLAYFLKNYKQNEIKETTFDSYMGIYRAHILNTDIGRCKLNELNSDNLQMVYNGMTKDGYNAKTVRHVFILINMALKKAVKLRYIDENANDFVTLPKKKRFEGKALTAEEARTIFDKAKEEKLYPIVALTLCTGMRKGEVMALKWENINFRDRELHVEGNLCRVRESNAVGRSKYVDKVLEPKSAKSIRTIPLTEKALEALLIQKHRQDEIKERYKVVYDDQGFVFTEVDGSLLRQKGFMEEYHVFLKKYGISDIRFHDLRHTFATLLFEEGESAKVIQELLGHSTITITMDIYTHVSKKGKKNAISKLDNLF